MHTVSRLRPQRPAPGLTLQTVRPFRQNDPAPQCLPDQGGRSFCPPQMAHG